MAYSITSSSGLYYGKWEADSKAEALLKNHRKAGYGPDKVWLEDGELRFKDEDYRQLIGGVEDWHVERI